MKKREEKSNVNDQIRAKNRRALMEDVGLLFFLAGILAAALLVGFSESEALRMENLVMFLILAGGVVLFPDYGLMGVMTVLCFFVFRDQARSLGSADQKPGFC